MSEQDLDHADILLLFEQVCRETMALIPTSELAPLFRVQDYSERLLLVREITGKTRGKGPTRTRNNPTHLRNAVAPVWWVAPQSDTSGYDTRQGFPLDMGPFFFRFACVVPF